MHQMIGQYMVLFVIESSQCVSKVGLDWITEDNEIGEPRLEP